MPPQRSRWRIIALLFLFLAATAGAETSAVAAPAASALPTVAGQSAPAPAASAPLRRSGVALLAPERLGQGDLLLAWVVRVDAPTDIGLSGASAPLAPRPVLRLLGPDGSLAAEERCFALPSILEREGARAAGLDARVFGALVALPNDIAPGAYTIVAASEAGAGPPPLAEARASLVIEARDFPLEAIKLDEANAALLNRPGKRKEAEARKLRALLATTDDSAVFADFSPFLFPVRGGFKSAGFGDRRRYALPSGGSELSTHAGLDWGVVAGTAVRSCERGKVVMTADREVTGKTVVIEHLPGLYSLYFHLSSIAVRTGAFVERGERIGLSGSSGMSTGPHLHWELRAKGRAVDPERWLGTALLDKEAIKATINGLIEGR